MKKEIQIQLKGLYKKTGENSNETWAMVVSRRKQQGKTTEQEGKRDLKTSKVIELAKGGEQTVTFSTSTNKQIKGKQDIKENTRNKRH